LASKPGSSAPASAEESYIDISLFFVLNIAYICADRKLLTILITWNFPLHLQYFCCLQMWNKKFYCYFIRWRSSVILKYSAPCQIICCKNVLLCENLVKVLQTKYYNIIHAVLKKKIYWKLKSSILVRGMLSAVWSVHFPLRPTCCDWLKCLLVVRNVCVMYWVVICKCTAALCL